MRSGFTDPRMHVALSIPSSLFSALYSPFLFTISSEQSTAFCKCLSPCLMKDILIGRIQAPLSTGRALHNMVRFTKCFFRCLASSREPDCYRRRERTPYGLATARWAAAHELQLAKDQPPILWWYNVVGGVQLRRGEVFAQSHVALT